VEISQITSPPLTTVDQPKYETGKAAIEMLLNMMAQDGIHEPEHRVIGVRLIERQSCRRVSVSAGPNRKTAKQLTAGPRSGRLSRNGSTQIAGDLECNPPPDAG
jgi:hypothetical protein